MKSKFCSVPLVLIIQSSSVSSDENRVNMASRKLDLEWGVSCWQGRMNLTRVRTIYTIPFYPMPIYPMPFYPMPFTQCQF